MNMKKIYALLIAVLCMGFTAQAQFNVTFQVDMSAEASIADTVSVAGDFQVAAGFPTDWTPGSTLLTDSNMDSIYDVTVQLPAGTYQFKYLNGAAWGTDESVPGACAVSGNREVVVAGDMTIDVVPFGGCPAAADTVMVTFQVDMSNETVADSVTIAGDFQGSVIGETWGNWTPGISVLTDPDMDNVYTLTVMLPEGTYGYKYINGVAWGSDESVPSSCAVNNNRELVVTGPGPIVIPVHCYATCDTCVPLLPPINVTFRVDMSNAIINSAGLFVAGSFQNPAWEKDSLEMMDPDMDQVYEHTESIVPNEYQYKYFNGGSMDPDDGEFGSNDPGMCATSNGLGGYNRILDISGMTTDTILPIFEFNTCNTVAASIIDGQIVDGGIIVFPNPFDQNATLRVLDYDYKSYQLRIVNLMGQTVWQLDNVRSAEVEIDGSGLNAGVYFMEIQKDGLKATQKIIIE